MSIQFLVIMVPVLLGFMGFAIDLGRMYLVRGELNQAASAMAVAAASRLNGTIAATDNATSAANLTLDNSLGDGNKFNFGSLSVGQTNGVLDSLVQEPAYFPAAADAITALGQIGAASTADGTIARHVTINLTADSPLVFWSLLALGQTRKTTIAGAAVAGVSAPVCTACGIEPFAIAAIDTADPTNFGFVAGNIYTLGFSCSGAPPALLPGTTGRLLQYLVIDRYDTAQAFTEDQQLFRTGAQGLVPSPVTPGWACSLIGNTEPIWATAVPRACAVAGAPQPQIQQALCGVSSRLTDPTAITACTTGVTDIANIAAAYTADPDTTSITDYTTYIGDNKRLMTLPIVDTLSTTGTMIVQGFRQFLLEPTTNSTTNSNNPADGNGRFAAMYLGTVAPVKAGNVGGACGVTSGPGKVVLHR
ncbi:MAG TPA: pilus assembly protein TadG-related protein [Bryobacteraceae bacterium]|nr:pilus assembly protein TadG-related protein [Bryobacteraceae bacterium]